MTAKWMACVTLALVATACSDGGTGPGSEPAAFTAEHSAYAPYSVAVLTLNGSAPSTDVQGTFGTEPVTLMPAGDSAVMFMVPRLSGSQALEFTANGRTYRGNISVTSFTPVAQPVEYLSAAADEAEEMLAALELEIEQDTVPLDDDVAALMQVARDSLASFRAHLAALTPDEAQLVADVARATLAEMGTSSEQAALRVGIKHATAYGQIPYACRGESTQLDQYACTWWRFIDAVADATLGLAGGALALKALAPFPIAGAVVGGLVGAYGALHAIRSVVLAFHLVKVPFMFAVDRAQMIAELVWEGGTEWFRANIYDYDQAAPAGPNGFALAGAAFPPTTMTTFTAGARASFTFQPQMRPLQPADRELGLDWLTKGLDLIARYNRLVGRVSTGAQVRFAPPTTSYLEPVPYQQIDVRVVENENVTVQMLGGEGGRVDLVFTSSAGGEQEFTYDIVYTSGVYPAISVRYEATLHPATYRLGALADTTLLGDTITVFGGGVQNMYFLMLDNGSLADGFYMPQNTAALPTGVQHFSVAGNGGHYVYLYGRLPLTNITADTFDISVASFDNPGNPSHLFDATVVLVDSAGAYHNYITGTWETRTYRPDNVLVESNIMRYGADGSGTHVSSTFYPRDHPPETTTYNEPFTWWIRTELAEGRPIYRLASEWESSSTHGPRLPGYGLSEFETTFFFFSEERRMVWTKQ